MQHATYSRFSLHRGKETARNEQLREMRVSQISGLNGYSVQIGYIMISVRMIIIILSYAKRDRCSPTDAVSWIF